MLPKIFFCLNKRIKALKYFKIIYVLFLCVSSLANHAHAGILFYHERCTNHKIHGDGSLPKTASHSQYKNIAESTPTIEFMFNHPNRLSADLDKVKACSTDQLLNYIKLMLLAEEEMLSAMAEAEAEAEDHRDNGSGSDKKNEDQNKGDEDEESDKDEQSDEDKEAKEGVNCAETDRITLLQDRESLFYPLYRTLSMVYCQGVSFTDFLKYLILNQRVKVTERPLLKVMIRLCKDYPGISIGAMLKTVESQKPRDPEIKQFLTYKANDFESQRQALMGVPKKSVAQGVGQDNSKAISWSSWLGGACKGATTHCFNKACEIIKTPLAWLGLVGASLPICSGVKCDNGYSADIEIDCSDTKTRFFLCTNGQKIGGTELCDNKKHCIDKSDEQAKNCCTGNVDPDRMCNVRDGNTRFVCNDDDMTNPNFRCDGDDDCNDGSDELASGENPTCFKCSDSNVIRVNRLCDGVRECDDGSDELARDCCENGVGGVDSATQTCWKKGSVDQTPENLLFVCNGDMTIPNSKLCDGSQDCNDGSDEFMSGENPSCFSCSNGTVILRELHCNGHNDCSDGIDESSCPGGTSGWSTGLIAGVVVGGVVVGVIAGVCYVKLLYDERTQIASIGKGKWLLLPITNLFRKCGYQQADQAGRDDVNCEEDNELELIKEE